MTDKYKLKRLKKIQLKNRKRKNEFDKYIEDVKNDKCKTSLCNDA